MYIASGALNVVAHDFEQDEPSIVPMRELSSNSRHIAKHDCEWCSKPTSLGINKRSTG